MPTKYSHSVVSLLMVAMVSIAACKESKKKTAHPSPAGYDLNTPELMKLSDRLNEVSGLAYYPKDSSIFAIVDENGVLFKLARTDEKINIQHWKFSKSGDYEDMVLKDSSFFVMKSKGDIIVFKFESPDSVSTIEYDIPLAGKNEFEILYYDEDIKKLVLVCKECDADDKTRLSTWFFDPEARAFTQGSITIDPTPILEKQVVDEKRFKPSAAAVHPITKELYMISSINKVLVIADRNGKAREVYPLDPKVFKQPEGITFTPGGDMFISNEAAGEGLANLLYYKYKNVGHEN